MSTPVQQTVVEPLIEHTPVGGTIADRLIAIVGFDGSETAERALTAAAKLIAGRVGSLEVVFVAHPSAAVSLSPYSQGQSTQIFDEEEVELADAVAKLLGDERRWHFSRRDGAIADQLVAAAEQTHADYEPGTEIIIVVGRAAHAYHHVVGSVPVALVRHGLFPVLVVP
jgi:nucleotide-binding universal stress UspA family protein